jgi:hypothetical protein
MISMNVLMDLYVTMILHCWFLVPGNCKYALMVLIHAYFDISGSVNIFLVDVPRSSFELEFLTQQLDSPILANVSMQFISNVVAQT